MLGYFSLQPQQVTGALSHGKCIPYLTCKRPGSYPTPDASVFRYSSSFLLLNSTHASSLMYNLLLYVSSSCRYILILCSCYRQLDSPSIVEQLSQGPSLVYNTFIDDSS